jgi:voltage-gated potassium channel Kch
MPGPVITHQVQKFRRNPVSVRNAMALILTATTITVFASGLLMWLVDRDNFPSIGVALWWAIQTVTTVGYGDVVPTTALGRTIGSFVLIESIAFLSIVTATITSTFVEQARRQRQQQTGEPTNHDIADMLAELTAKVDHLEASIRELRDGPQSRSGRDQ